jgi:hypothetical protein
MRSTRFWVVPSAVPSFAAFVVLSAEHGTPIDMRHLRTGELA